jgi:hypothetical protein
VKFKVELKKLHVDRKNVREEIIKRLTPLADCVAVDFLEEY